MKRLFLIPLIIVLTIGLVFGSCNKPATTPLPTPALSPPPAPTTTPTEPATPTELTPRYGGTLKIISFPIPATIGWPAQPIGSPSMVIQVCMETLLRGDSQGNIYPWLAESYKVADDLMSITFNLRKDVKFHDGSDFNAEAAKWNLDNYIDIKVHPEWASVDILDEYTIRVNFTEWINTLPASFADAIVSPFMVSKAAFDKNGLKWMRANPVGTGPFKFVSFQQDVSFKTVKNPDYWQKDAQGNQLPYLDGIEYIFIADDMTRKSAMQTGEGDMAGIMTGKEAADYAALGLQVNVVMDMPAALVPNTASADSPWANQKVREAVEYAIDREAIAKAFGYGYLQAPYQVPSRYSLAYNPDFTLGRKYDPDKAKQLLAEAGYPDGFEATIIAYSSDTGDILMAVQAYLAKAGIRANLDFPEMGKWVTYMGPGTWPDDAALYMAISPINVENTGGLQFIHNVIGQSWLRTPEMTQAYQAAISAPAADVKLTRAVTDLLTKDASLIPVNEGLTGQVLQPYVIAGFNERGTSREWNAEEAWLNK